MDKAQAHVDQGQEREQLEKGLMKIVIPRTQATVTSSMIAHHGTI